jgi:E3 ubiquitin-protein ligase DOA10
MTVWAVLTTVLVVLLIYRSVLTMHEDDQLFLDNAEAHLEREQQQLTVRMNRLRPFVNILGASSGVLVLIMAGLWLWRGWNGL